MYDRKLPNEQAAIDYFCQVRYGGILPVLTAEQKQGFTAMGNGRRSSIARPVTIHFPPFSGTIFKKPHIDMRMWFYAIHLIINDKRGISGYQLQRETGVTYR
jgi:hypothetical protein